MADLKAGMTEDGHFNGVDISEDWPKFNRWPLYWVTNISQMRRWLEGEGQTAEDFKAGPLYARFHDEIAFLQDL